MRMMSALLYTFRPLLSMNIVFICTKMSTKKTKSTTRFSAKSATPPTVSTSVSKNPSSNGVTRATNTRNVAVRRSHRFKNSESCSMTPAVSSQSEKLRSAAARSAYFI